MACATYRAVEVNQRESITANESIYKYELVDGTTVECGQDPTGGAMLQSDGVERVARDGTIQKTPYSHIRRFYTKEFTTASVVTSSLLIGGTVALLGLLLWAQAWGGF
jgi:hypothetical protein